MERRGLRKESGMKCSECKKECKNPITKVDMSFDTGDMRLGAADWDDGKRYCGVKCMMKALTREAYEVIRDGGEE